MKHALPTVSLALPLVLAACGGGAEDGAEDAREELPLSPLSADDFRLRPDRLAYKFELVDAAADEWDTEVLSEAVYGRLRALERWMVEGKLDASAVGGMVDASFACGPLRAPSLRTTYDSGGITVRVAEGGGSGSGHAGAAGFASALEGLVAPFADGRIERVFFKLVTIEAADDGLSTGSRCEIFGVAGGRRIQQDMDWACRWTLPVDGEGPRLRSIEVRAFEEVAGGADENGLFEDCTEAVFAGNPSYRDELLYGASHWASRVDKALGVDMLGHAGLSVGDANGDGRDDLYVCQPGGLPNRLFLQGEDGKAQDVAGRSGVDYLDLTRSALFLDLDNDGDQDLVVGTLPVTFNENDGNGRFTERARVDAHDTYSMAAADYDRNGFLDVYACSYALPDEAVPMPYHDANNGPPNFLFRNKGDWEFDDVTDRVGLDRNNSRYSFAASWHDYDEDGDPDLYVANDFGRNNLYRNDKTRFFDSAGFAGVEDISAGMSVTWGDTNGDGHLDVYVGNMFSSAGNRVAYQRQFQEGATSEVRGQFQRHARGNSLFEYAGDGTFRDVSVERGVTLGRWAWGSKLVDVNNDGRLDVFVTNGLVTNADTGDL